MRRTLYDSDHEQYRALVRDFIESEVVPVYADWEHEGIVPRDVFRQLGKLGVMGIAIPEEYGGGGIDDYRYNAVLQEEMARAAIWLGTIRTHLDVVLPYFLSLASAEQQARWFPGLAAGDLYTAIAMTEPGTGSDLAGMTTNARLDGDTWILNGAKTFITGGESAELVIVCARTSTDPANRRNGLSLLVVEKGMAGFTVGRRLQKLGLKTQDTVELSFDAVRVPAANLLGEEGAAFSYLGNNLAQERLAIAVGSVAQCQAALRLTIDYVKQRPIFGTTVAAMQNTKFELAAVAADLEAAQTLVDKAIVELNEGELTPVDSAKIKLFCTELQSRVMDRCLQLFGGYGYVLEYPIARLYADARVTRIYGGTSEVMKSIISKSLSL